MGGWGEQARGGERGASKCGEGGGGRLGVVSFGDDMDMVQHMTAAWLAERPAAEAGQLAPLLHRLSAPMWEALQKECRPALPALPSAQMHGCLVILASLLAPSLLADEVCAASSLLAFFTCSCPKLSQPPNSTPNPQTAAREFR